MISDTLAADLADIDARALRRVRRVIGSPQGPRVEVEGRQFLNFCSNDYLGLASDPEVIAAAAEGAGIWGVGAGASHLVSGHSEAHHALETTLAQHVGQDRALLFSSGYQANIGLVTALAGRGDTVYADRLNHASLNDAALLSRATLRRYSHGDVSALERLLAERPDGRKIIVTDAVFSMDGDIAPLPRLLELAETHDAWLIIDDAHGYGVLGERGAGSLAHFHIRSPRIAYMATLGKAAGVSGAFVAGSDTLIEWLIQRARTYIYTTAMSPLLAYALSCSVKKVSTEQWRRDQLRSLVALLRGRLSGSRYRLMPSETPIQPLVVGSNEAALDLAARLAGQGVMVPAIRPPTVPANTARLRISISATHSVDDVGRLADSLLSLA